VSGLAWVVGRGGLLGSAVERALRAVGRAVFVPDPPLSWTSAGEASADAAVHAFGAARAAAGPAPWSLFWCAGRGVVGSPAAELDDEVRRFETFLDRLSVIEGPGRVFLASSAGGVYGGSPERPLTEEAVPRPLSDYGRAKLAQERALARWGERHPQVATLVGRLSNLYGPGQRLGKAQGLVSQLARGLIHDAPVHVYVSLDTIRDYLFADDAGRRVVAAMDRLGASAPAGGPAPRVLKIFAAERETTIATLLGVFRRLARRRLRIVSGLHPVREQQPARLQFRSRVWADEPAAGLTLLEGVDRVYRHQLALYQQGRLPPPAAAPPA
jgi:UDP-glucose 4-epimerase